MEKGKLISIIVPIYNVENYLDRCLKSIINQSYKNLEIILVEDASTDHSQEIAEKYRKIDERIKLLVHQKNAGLSAARNTGLANATGQYIGFVDSDDYIEEDMYQVLYELLEKNDADISICGHKRITEKTVNTTENQKEDIKLYDSEGAIREILVGKTMDNFAWDKLFKKELFKLIKFPLGKYTEDIAIMYLLFHKANRIVETNKKKYNYVIRGDSITGIKSKQKMYDFLEINLERYQFIDQHYPKLDIYNKYRLVNSIAIVHHQLGYLDEQEAYNSEMVRKSYQVMQKLISENEAEIVQYMDLKDKVKLYNLLLDRDWFAEMAKDLKTVIKGKAKEINR